MAADPKVRPDGLCALPGCGRPRPKLAVVEGDPFHSALCARRFHGVVFESDSRVIRAGFAEARGKGGGAYSDHDQLLAIENVRRVAEARGRTPTSREWRNEKHLPAWKWLIKAFGSWSMFLAAAGLAPSTRWDALREEGVKIEHPRQLSDPMKRRLPRAA